MDLLWEASMTLNSEVKWLTDEVIISTIVGQTDYNLPADFQELYITDSFNQFVIRVFDGTADTFFKFRDFDRIYYDRQHTPTTQAIPNFFSIAYTDAPTRVSGTVTSSGASVNDESTLTDSSAPFANVSSGDSVHNITDDSDGLVLSKTSSSALVTALYDGTNNDWTNSDEYVITLQPRITLVIDPPPSISGYSIYVPYIKRPDPVYSRYGQYSFPESWRSALTKYVAWIYKYRDKEPNYGDAWYKYYEDMLRRAKRMTNRAKVKSHFKVNFNKYAMNDRSWR
jgi:hypothetical protein